MTGIILAFLGLAVLTPQFVYAQSAIQKDIVNQLDAGAGPNGAAFPEPDDPQKAVGALINTILSTMGIIFIILLAMGGYWRLTSQGSEERIEKGKKTMVGAVIGLAVTLMAYSIANFILPRVQNAASQNTVYEIEQ